MAVLKDLIVNGGSRFIGSLTASKATITDIYATTVTGALSGNAATATKATQDESGNNIKASYASSISISGNTLTLSNKNGTSLATATIPSELPSVTSSDNGKVLRVVSGEWSAVSLPSASGVSF